MISEEIKRYVAEQQAAGFTNDQISDALAAGGWATADITALLAPSVPPPPPPHTPLPGTTPPGAAEVGVAAMSNEPATTRTTPTETVPVVFPASAGKRLGEYLLDLIFRVLFTFVVWFVIGFVYGFSNTLLQLHLPAFDMWVKSISWLLALVTIFAYYVIFEAIFQRTVGKLITGTKVVRIDGTRPGFLQVCGRTLARFIPFEVFSFLFYGRYPTKGWHDRFSSTLVVPVELTADEVTQIDPEQIKAAPNTNLPGWIIAIAIVIPAIIVIIGLLASVVLSSLSAARAKGADAFIKSNLDNMRAQAELYYNTNNFSYAGVCTDPMVRGALASVAQSSHETPFCSATATTYVMAGKLSTGDMFCVDSTGAASTTPTVSPTQVLCDPTVTAPAAPDSNTVHTLSTSSRQTNTLGTTSPTTTPTATTSML